VDDFTRRRQQIRAIAGSEVELKKNELPATTETVVLRPAL